MSYLPVLPLGRLPWPSAVKWGREAETEWLIGLTVGVKVIVKGVRGRIGAAVMFLLRETGSVESVAGWICAIDLVVVSKGGVAIGGLGESSEEETAECLVKPTEGEIIVIGLVRYAASDLIEKAALVTDFVAGVEIVTDLLEAMEGKVGMVGWGRDPEEGIVVVTLMEDGEVSVVDVIEVSERGFLVGDVERVSEKEISVNGGISGLIVGLCLIESIVGEIKVLDLGKVFLGREGEWGKGTHIEWGGACIVL